MNRKQIRAALIAAGAIVLILLLVLGVNLIQKNTPSKERTELTEYYGITNESQVAITLNNSVLNTYASMINGHVYLDYRLVHDELNSRFYWDANENVLLYTTASKVISAKADETRYYVGKSSNEFGRPIVKASADSAWIDLEFVKEYSDFTYSIFESPSRIVITNDWKEITVCTLRNNTEVRLKTDIKSPILSEVKKGDTLTILENDKKWAKVCTEDGITGYVPANKVKKTKNITLTSEYEEETFHHIRKDETINFLWHPVSGTPANSEIASLLSNSKGVNVVSPTWFKLKNNKGYISSYASTDYVDYCHSQGVQVWAMVKNTDLDVSGIDTNEILTHTSSRQNLVNQLVSQALQYNLDGINVDFRQLNESSIGDAYIQFLRELSIKCENNDIILSTTVPVPESDNGVYKYKEQSYFVDYICLMAYDQHSSQETGEGSVASLDWVETNIKATLDKGISPDQLVLGVPFHTRLWNLTPTSSDEDSETAYLVGFTNYGLTTAKNWMNDNISEPVWLEEAGQYYGEIVKGGVTYKMWLEDSSSIEKKLALIPEYKLAGAAFWNSDLDNPSIWDVIIKYIN